MHSLSVVVCAAGVVGASGKVVVGRVVDGGGNSEVDADNSSSRSQGWNGQLPSHVGGQMRQQPFQQQYVHRQQQQHQ